MPTPRPPDGPKHDAILGAALSLFGEQGFHGTTVPEVAARARVAAGTLYRYYPSKEALVNALYRQWKQALSETLFDALPAGAPLREQFHHLWVRLLRFAQEHQDALVFLETHHHGSYLDAESRRCEQAVHRRAAALLQAGRAGRLLKRLPADTLVAVAWGAFIGVLKAHWAGLVTLDAAAAEAAERCAWDAIAR